MCIAIEGIGQMAASAAACPSSSLVGDHTVLVYCSEEHGRDLVADRRVRVADPGDLSGKIQRCREPPSALVGEHHAGLARDQLGAQVVWVAAQAEFRATSPEQGLHEWTQVGYPAVVAHRELIQLPART